MALNKCMVGFLLLSSMQSLHAVEVSGSVTLLVNGQAAVGTELTLVQSSFFGDTQIAQTTIDGTGAYSFSSPATGFFRLNARLEGHVYISKFFEAPNNTPLIQNLSLSLPSSIALTVRDAGTLLPVPGVNVRLVTSAEQLNVTTDAAGQVAWNAIAGGMHKICVIDPNDAFLNECFDNHHLPAGNNLASVPETMLGSGQSLTLVIDLDPGARIRGVLTDRYLNAPIQGEIIMNLYDSSGVLVDTSKVNPAADGSYTLAGLPAAGYFVDAAGTGPNFYSRRLYQDIDCAVGCTITSGSQLNAIGTQEIAGIDFSLHPGTIATGLVTDSVSGTPIAGASVSAYWVPIPGFVIERARTQTRVDGTYTLAHIGAAGQYYLGTREVTDHINEAWPNVPCYRVECERGVAQVFAADEIRGGFDFALDRGAAVSGDVIGLNTGEDLQATINIRNADSSLFTLTAAGYQSPGYLSVALPAGTYYAWAEYASGTSLLCQVYSQQACSSSDPINVATATPITVASSGTVTGVDFSFADDIFFGNGFEGP